MSLCVIVPVAVLLPLSAAMRARAEKVVVVAQRQEADFVGTTGEAIVAAIEEVSKAGGGTVIIKAGTYTVRDAIRLQSVSDITLMGEDGTALKLADEIHSTVAEEAGAGDARIVLASAEGLREGDRLEVQSPGRTDSFSGHQQPYFNCVVKAVRGDEVELAEALRYDAPVGKVVVRVQRLFDIGGKSANVTLQGLTLDGNIRDGDARVINHTYHCGVFAQGPYSYTDGPKPDRPERVRVLDCRIRRFFHRGIALYNVADALIAGCVIEDTGAEAIDFDHFCVNCHAVDNTLRRCGVGVEINDASDCIVCGNVIEDCGVGVNVWRWCKQDWVNRGNLLLGNTIRSAKRAGISLGKETDSNRAVGNVVEGCKDAGIALAGDRCHVSGNTIRKNAGGGLIVTGAGNVIVGNDSADNGDGTAEQQMKVTGEGNVVLP